MTHDVRLGRPRMTDDPLSLEPSTPTTTKWEDEGGSGDKWRGVEGKSKMIGMNEYGFQEIDPLPYFVGREAGIRGPITMSRNSVSGRKKKEKG